jgi:hypothetical protein
MAVGRASVAMVVLLVGACQAGLFRPEITSLKAKLKSEMDFEEVFETLRNLNHKMAGSDGIFGSPGLLDSQTVSKLYYLGHTPRYYTPRDLPFSEDRYSEARDLKSKFKETKYRGLMPYLKECEARWDRHRKALRNIVDKEEEAWKQVLAPILVKEEVPDLEVVGKAIKNALQRRVSVPSEYETLMKDLREIPRICETEMSRGNSLTEVKKMIESYENPYPIYPNLIKYLKECRERIYAIQRQYGAKVGLATVESALAKGNINPGLVLAWTDTIRES